MCLGIPARIVDVDGGHPDLVLADVQGAVRPVNAALLAEADPVHVGDWVVLHMGMALEKMSAAEAEEALQVLETLGPGDGFELGAAADPFAEDDAPW